DEIDDFFKSPSEQQSSNLFGKVEQRHFQRDRQREGRDKLSEMSLLIALVVTQRLISLRFCRFCGNNIVSSEDEPSLDYDDAVRKMIGTKMDTLPKVDK
ncbi:5904_t:CDS:2, partial [Acaulospora morrowiae]